MKRNRAYTVGVFLFLLGLLFKPVAVFSQENPQQQYESKSPEGMELNEEEVIKLGEGLDYTEQPVKKKEAEEKKQKKEKKEQESTQPSRPQSRLPEGSTFNSGGKQGIVYALAAVALISLVVFLILRLSRKKEDLPEEAVSVNDERISDARNLSRLRVDDELTRALEKGDFRLAVRILYLKNLKMLMEKGMIQPSPEKTNFDYVREIKNQELKKSFRYTTGIFELVWYGESLVDQAKFGLIRNDFSVFENRVKVTV